MTFCLILHKTQENRSDDTLNSAQGTKTGDCSITDWMQTVLFP